MVIFSQAIIGTVNAGQGSVPADSLRVWSSPGLYSMTRVWAEEFSRENPAYRVVVNRSDDDITSIISAGGMKMAFATDEMIASDVNASLWRMVVARDVIVPVINSENPFISIIEERGISPSKLGQMLSESTVPSWERLIDTDTRAQIHLFRVDDASVDASVSDFLGNSSFQQRGVMTAGSEEMIKRIKGDRLAIGFCRLADIISPAGNEFIEGVRVMPVDINSNGRVDYFENIYGDLNSLAKGVWIGKYPKSLFTNIYAVAPASPVDKGEAAFLRWIITEGQNYLNSSGFSGLVLNERQSKLDKLAGETIILTAVSEEPSARRIVIILVAAILVAGFIGGSFISLFRSRKGDEKKIDSDRGSVFDRGGVAAPGGLYYDKTHTWAFLERDGIVRIGIDDFLQRVTGRVTRLIMKKPGEKVKRGERILTLVQKGKQMNIYSPMSGTIVESNKLLETESSLINRAPFGEGWVYMVEPDNWSRDIQHMSMSINYLEWLGEEFTRLRDFLAGIIKRDDSAQLSIVLQDGGEIKESVLEELGPQVWEDFQTVFLDPSRL